MSEPRGTVLNGDASATHAAMLQLQARFWRVRPDLVMIHPPTARAAEKEAAA